MLFRFSLYGFLKNQRYFEPFLILAFLDKGLSFFEIGLLIAFREIVVNILEIPSGAFADVRGRRPAMVASFVAYVASFATFGWADSFILLLPAMLLFAVGETFRSGTHKAMIFAWLRNEGRVDERTRVYGYTRSWSKYGSAVAVLVGALIVITTNDYSIVFYLAAVPYLINIVNISGYPSSVDVVEENRGDTRRVFRHAVEALRETVRRAGLRRLLLESMGFEGTFHAAKDYLQPVLQAAAIAWLASIAGDWSDARKTALLVAPVYFVLHMLSGVASRNAHRIVDRLGDEDRAAHRIWVLALGVFVAMGASAYFDLAAICVIAFIALHVLQNFWRPVLISRIDRDSEEDSGATLLSIESQSRRAATMITAPLLGLAVDSVPAVGIAHEFWPVGAFGTMLALVFVALGPAGRSTPRPSD